MRRGNLPEGNPYGTNQNKTLQKLAEFFNKKKSEAFASLNVLLFLSNFLYAVFLCYFVLDITITTTLFSKVLYMIFASSRFPNIDSAFFGIRRCGGTFLPRISSTICLV